MVAVLAEITDALALLHATGQKRIRDLVGVTVEFLEARVAALEGEGRFLRLGQREGARDVGNGLPVFFSHSVHQG